MSQDPSDDFGDLRASEQLDDLNSVDTRDIVVDLDRLRGPVPSYTAKEARKHLRESLRKWLALGVTILLAVEIAFLLLAAASDWLEIDEVKELATAILVPTFTLTGTVLGFYFSGNDR